jgi:hypothetical protein
MSADFNNIVEAVTAERNYQDRTHGTDPHPLGVWIILIEAELAEAKHALVKGGSGRNGLRSEIIQVAALCFAALEQHGLDEQVGRAI